MYYFILIFWGHCGNENLWEIMSQCKKKIQKCISRITFLSCEICVFLAGFVSFPHGSLSCSNPLTQEFGLYRVVFELTGFFRLELMVALCSQ